MNKRGNRILAIAKKNLQKLLSDKRTVGLLIFMPILMMVLFGYGFGDSVKHVPIKIANLDYGGSGAPPISNSGTYFSDILIQNLDSDERVDITLLDINNLNITEEKDNVYGEDNYYALVVFPVNFTENLLLPNSTNNIKIYIDGSELQSLASIQAAISSMLSDSLSEISGCESQIKLVFDFVAGSPDLRPIDTMAPAILSYSLLLFMILTVTGGFTKEKIDGTLDRTLVSPATKSDIILGSMIGNSIIALIQSILILVITVLLFNLNIEGSIWLLLVVLFIYAMSCVGIGIISSVFAETELQSFQFIPLLLLPSMFFSGFIFPLIALPKIFQYISYIIPMTYSIRISRAIMVNGFGLEHFLLDFIILIAYTFFTVLVGIILFRSKQK